MFINAFDLFCCFLVLFVKRKRDKLFAAWISYSHSSIAETFAKAGFDFIAMGIDVLFLDNSMKDNIKKLSRVFSRCFVSGHTFP